MALEFEWDSAKAAANAGKHGVAFEEARAVFTGPQYDPELIRRGVGNKYADRFPPNALAVVLDPDVAAAFPSADAVNGALRGLLELARR